MIMKEESSWRYLLGRNPLDVVVCVVYWFREDRLCEEEVPYVLEVTLASREKSKI